jgi:proteasome lid subunit RPN8/RPN11
MTVYIPFEVMQRIFRHGESAYPEEGAGLLLGRVVGDDRRVEAILELDNAREDGSRHNRYLITPQAMLEGEQEAERRGMDILGVFHSHPDHPNLPSDYDREWALPWYSYLITSVNSGHAIESRAWRLQEDRSGFDAEVLLITT